MEATIVDKVDGLRYYRLTVSQADNGLARAWYSHTYCDYFPIQIRLPEMY